MILEGATSCFRSAGASLAHQVNQGRDFCFIVCYVFSQQIFFPEDFPIILESEFKFAIDRHRAVFSNTLALFRSIMQFFAFPSAVR